MASKEFEMFVEQADRLASQGRLEEAVDMYQRALSIEPNDVMVRHNVINIYIKSGEFEPAVSEYLQWAKVCQENGLIDDAIAVYNELNDLENQVSKKSFMMGQRSAVGDIIKERKAAACRKAIVVGEEIGRIWSIAIVFVPDIPDEIAISTSVLAKVPFYGFALERVLVSFCEGEKIILCYAAAHFCPTSKIPDHRRSITEFNIPCLARNQCRCHRLCQSKTTRTPFSACYFHSPAVAIRVRAEWCYSAHYGECRHKH